jgi:hypothetical protein
MLLAHIMAEELFGQRTKGKPAGKKDFWTDARLANLGARRYELKKGDKNLTEARIAEIISKEEPFRAYKDNYEQIRQRLPGARKRYREYLKEQESNRSLEAAYEAFDPSDDWFHDEYS